MYRASRHHPLPSLRLIVITIAVVSSAARAQVDSVRQRFFDSLEISLRHDYRLCTADSTIRPLDELLKWKQHIDHALTDSTYPSIVRKFTVETGINPADARPCEIIRWYRNETATTKATDRFLDKERKRAEQAHSDSLDLEKELQRNNRAVYDLKGVPFGLTRKSFIVITTRYGFPKMITEDAVNRCDGFPLGVHRFKAAFHFNHDDRYWCYELESATFNIDSLNTGARPMVAFLAAQMESKTGKVPDHIYRVGQFDIVPGRLSICRMWYLEKGIVYIGLARTGNRFYAKAIVQMK